MASGDARPVPRKFTAFRVTFPIRDSNGDLATGAASLDSEVSINGAAFVDCANEAVEVGNGIYYLDLDTGDMQGDTVAVAVKSDKKTTAIVIYPEELGDIRVNAGQVDGDTGAADQLQKAFAAGFNDTGVNNRLDVIRSDTDTGIQSAVNVTQIIGDTGGASRLGQFARDRLSGVGQITSAATSITDPPHADIVRIDADTGAANYLRATFANGFADTGINDRLGRIGFDVDTGLRAQISDVDTGLHDALADYDTGVRGILQTTGVNVTAFADTGVNARLTTIQGKTDSLTFTVAGQVDSNIQYVNDVQVNGTGQSGDEWGP